MDATVMKGYFAYFAVPTNTQPLHAFRSHTACPAAAVWGLAATRLADAARPPPG